MPNSIKRLLAELSATGRGLGLECSRGGTDFRNRSGALSFVACELSEQNLMLVVCQTLPAPSGTELPVRRGT